MTTVRSKVDYSSPNDNEAYQELFVVCAEKGIDTELIKELLWSINAGPNMMGFIRIINNLNEVIKEVRSGGIISQSEINRLAPWHVELEELLKISSELVDRCGNQLNIAPKKKERFYHPLNQICLTRNPLYALLWTKVESEILERKLKNEGKHDDTKIREILNESNVSLKYLVWHLYVIHRSCVKNKITIENYLSYSETKGLVWCYGGSFESACKSARDYHVDENFGKVLKITTKTDTFSFWKRLMITHNEDLDNVASELKTLGTKWCKDENYLRSGSSKKREFKRRRTSTSYYVEYGEDLRVSRNDDTEREKGLIGSRVLSEWRPISGWTDEDLATGEQEKEGDTKIMIEVSCGKEKTKHDQVMAAIGEANKKKTTNQYLPIKYEMMTVSEVAGVMRVFGDVLSDRGASCLAKLSALIGIVSYWTGSSVELLARMKVVPEEDVLPDNNRIAYLQNEKLWRIKAPVYKLHKKPTREQKLQSRVHGEYLYLQDIWSFELMLQKAINSCSLESEKANWKNDQPFRAYTVTKYKEVIKKMFSDQHNEGFRINLSRIERDLQMRIMAAADPVVSAMITGREHHSMMVERHYSTPSREYVESVYSHIANDLYKKIKEERYGDISRGSNERYLRPQALEHGVGAGNCPTVSEVSSLLSRVRAGLDDAKDMYEYHETYVLYVILMISFGSGYRAVNRIDISEKYRDEESGFVWISDKDSEDRYHTRRVWIPQELFEQLKEYERYRDVVLATWEVSFPGVNIPVESEVPYLFYVNRDAVMVNICSASWVSGKLEEYEYYLPLNSNRRFIRTELVDRGCPIDVVKAQMGHWMAGQEPHGRYSTLSPRRIKEVMFRYMEPIFSDIGYCSITSRLTKGAC